MRTGHCLTQNHLNRIGVAQDTTCDCGQIGDINHIFFQCPIFRLNQIDLYEELNKCDLMASFNDKIVLAILKKIVYFSISVI